MSQKHKISLEILCYLAVYIGYLVYGLRAIYNVRDTILSRAKFEFAPGWTHLWRPRDNANDELENFSDFMSKNWRYYLIHAAITTVFRYSWPHKQCIGHAVACSLVLICLLQPVSVLIFGALVLSYLFVAQVESKSLTWILSALWMLFINVFKNSDYWHKELGYAEYFILIIMLSWSILRCCSFALNRINDRAAGVVDINQHYATEHFLGYVMYFPCLIYGPFMGYQRYAVLWRNENPVKLVPSCLRLSWQLLRIAFWWFAFHIALHYFYIHYMTVDVRAVQLVKPAFGQHAVGYFMGQAFFVFYVITYGLGIAFARFDGLNPPNPPRCIGRIHYYSDMWKYFDMGLYEFLFKYIYCELCGKRSPLSQKLFATAATFTFVFLWHGCYLYVLIWSILNFSCLVAEKCLKALLASARYTQFVGKFLSPGGTMRLNAVLGTQLYIPAAFSNVYFISGEEVGNYLMRGAYTNGILNYVGLTFCTYCFFQCSEWIAQLDRVKT